ncbi:MAG: hypothetical protein R3A80_08605 [Bdellovibrionota bacterium]
MRSERKIEVLIAVFLLTLHSFAASVPTKECYLRLKQEGFIREGKALRNYPKELEPMISKYAPEGNFEIFPVGKGNYAEVFRLKNHETG